jgi:hypothetical protein
MGEIHSALREDFAVGYMNNITIIIRISDSTCKA